MPAMRATLLCHYRYDALDRLIDQGLSDAPPLQRFYCKSRLATEIQGALRQTIFQHGDWLLAQQQQQGSEHDTALLATDLQRSVLNTLKTNQAQPIAYAPYGHRRVIGGWLSLMGFNGERPDPLTGHYLLGNGYRAFNPTLMRFNSPDNLSPFDEGGLNSYVYCLGDPINNQDPEGHSSWLFGLNQGLDMIKRGITRSLKPYSIPKKITTHTTKARYSARNVKPKLHGFSTLDNNDAAFLTNETKKYDNLQKVQKYDLIKPISNEADLRALNNDTSYKFIFTANEELWTGAAAKTKIYGTNQKIHTHISHAVIANTPAPKNVISAGYLTMGHFPEMTINNHSGHYRPPFKTLKPVSNFLKNLGADVTKVRHT